MTGCRPTTRTRRRLTIALEKVETLRYGENPHQPAARYRRPGATLADGPFGVERAAAPGQGALVQQRPRRGRGGGARPRAARPGRASSSSTPTRAAPPSGRRLARGLGGRAGRRPGQRLRWRRGADPRRSTRPLAERAGLDLPRGRRRAGLRRRTRSRSSPTKPNLRLVVDPRSGRTSRRRAAARPDRLDPHRRRRRPRHRARHRRRRPDDLDRARPAARPTDAEQLDLDLAWRLVRGVTSNAIVLVRDRRLSGWGGPDVARRRRPPGRRQGARDARRRPRRVGAACASDAFFPFPDAVEVCLAAGVHRVRPAGRLDARRRGRRGRRRGRRRRC